ncbi:MAG: DUF948 domain-containing protein [Nitriliruptorales bacterium]|nr:DUF948 domain-containing protein [Nitriliruptorales bacterium]
MAVPALVVLVTVGVVSLGAIAVAVIFLLQHLKSLAETLREVNEELQPALEQLARDTEVTRRELERVSESASQLAEDE